MQLEKYYGSWMSGKRLPSCRHVMYDGLKTCYTRACSTASFNVRLYAYELFARDVQLYLIMVQENNAIIDIVWRFDDVKWASIWLYEAFGIW